MDKKVFLQLIDDLALIYPDVQNMLRSDYGHLLIKRVHELREHILYHSEIHGKNHNYRVLMLGAMIAYLSDMEMRDYELYLYACSYHDVGRINDSYDTHHGQRSAGIIEDDNPFEGDDLRILLGMVSAHSIPDDSMDMMLKHYEVEDMDRARSLAKRFKDADGLDRVRINHLDPAYLRSEAGMSLVDFSYELHNFYVKYEPLKTAIIYKSYHHGNTRAIGKTMAKVMNADLIPIEEIENYDIDNYDLIGIGSGIYALRYHAQIRKWLAKEDSLKEKRIFLFATYGFDSENFHNHMIKLLEDRGAEIVGTFGTVAYDTFGPLKMVGGINKGRPDEEDLKKAEAFAADIYRKELARKTF